MVFEEINPGMWLPEKDGDCIEGVFIKAESDVGANKSMLYTIDANKVPTGVWGSAILDQRMAAIVPGVKVRITFKGLGEKKAGHNAPKIFKVEVDRETEDNVTTEKIA